MTENKPIESEMAVNKTIYHSVKIPTSDVYAKAGSKVFQSLDRGKKTDIIGEKNLVLLPDSTLQELKLLKHDREYRNKLGEFFSDLDEISSDTSKITFFKSSNEDGLTHTIVPLTDGLDIAIVKDNLNLEDLVTRSKKQFKPKDKQNAVEFISSDADIRFEYNVRKLPVDKPGFLVGDIGILKQGTLSGSENLWAELEQNKKVLPVKDAVKFFDPGTELYMNQLIRYGNDYAIVTGDLIRSKGKVIDSENLEVKILSHDDRGTDIKVGISREKTLFGISPRDMSQKIALNKGILNPDVSLVFLVGGAGSGKTLLSYLGAIYQILEYGKERIKEKGWENPFEIPPPTDDVPNPLRKLAYLKHNHDRVALYRDLILLKPDDAVGGREVGFLPGDMFAKIEDDLKPYSDAHELSTLYKQFEFQDLILHPTRETKYGSARNPKANAANFSGGKLPGYKPAFKMTFSGKMRGRSFENALMIIDEAQNFTPEEMDIILSRMGIGSKVIIMGDPDLQVDNPRCSRDRNGLVQTIEHYLPKPYSILVNLTSNYRSEISEDSLTWRP